MNHVITVSLVCDRACGGELQMLLDRDEVPSERQVVRLMRQILDGLIYLHDFNVAHLDIKVSLRRMEQKYLFADCFLLEVDEAN